MKPSARGELEITDVNRAYLRHGELAVEIMGRGMAWLDTGTHDSLIAAATLLRLLDERPEVRVVCDQIGSPTAAAGLAAALWRAAEHRLTSTHHWTDAGIASWYDFAVAIQASALSHGLLSRTSSVVPINSAAFPTTAERPSFSILDKQDTWDSLNLRAEHWQEALHRTLAKINPETPLHP